MRGAVAVLTLGIGLHTAALADPGTYQLFSGGYPFVNLKGEQQWIPTLFKINTATGEVWIATSSQYLTPTKEKVIQVRKWVPFEEELTWNPLPQDLRDWSKQLGR